MSPPGAQDLPALRDYEVEGVIATGSSGTFYSGRHRLTAHPVALQCVAPHLAETPGFVDRLGEAARSVAGLRNPHLVGVYDLVVEDGVFLVLELVPGASLRAIAPPGQALPPAAAIAAVDDVLNALETAHQAGIVHGDIRAEHVLVTPNGIAKLGGFSVAQALQVLPGQPGAGRPGYASPERLSGRPPDEASDLYATAALASELMTGATPSPGRVGPPALPAVADVLRRGLSVDASRRYGSATELRTALIGATAGSMGPAWRLASDLGSRAIAAAPHATTAAAGAAAEPVPTPITPMAAMAPPPPTFSTPPPPASTAAQGGPQPAPMARPPVSPPSSYLPPPTPRARAAITEVDSEDRRRPPWLIPLIAVLALALVAGGVLVAYAMGAFGGGGGTAKGPLTIGSDVKLTVSPPSGGCNTVFEFTATGSITGGSGTMTYRWERSDGFHTADIPVTISPTDGSFSLQGPAWRISGKQPALQMTFHIVSPTERVVTQTVPYTCQ